jgi:hypothetical protein
VASPADAEDLLTDDKANKDSATGEIAGPVFLPLRHRPTAPKSQTSVAENAARKGEAEAARRRQRPARDKLRFAPSR